MSCSFLQFFWKQVATIPFIPYFILYLLSMPAVAFSFNSTIVLMPKQKHPFPEFLRFCCWFMVCSLPPPNQTTFKYWNDLCSVVTFLPVISIILLIICLNFSEEDFFLFHTVKYCVQTLLRLYVLTPIFFFTTQGPLPNTCCHFWLMVWQQQTKAVVMLNRTVEKESVSNIRPKVVE